MKLALLLLLSLAWVQAQTPPPPPAGALQWKETTVKLETLGRLGALPASFEFKNTGKKPVTITSIQTSCGCTVAESSQRVTAPGDTGEITLQYTPTGGPGVRYYHVTVQTDEAGAPAYALKLQVVHEPRVAMDKRLLVWEQGEPRKAKVVKLTPKPGDPIRIVGAKAEKDLFKFELKDGAAPGEKLLTVTPRMFAGTTGGKTRIHLITEPPTTVPTENQIFAILR